jgi:hypothetical protein
MFHIAKGKGHSLAGNLQETSSQATPCQHEVTLKERDLILTPPLSQMRISLSALGLTDGTNKKYNLLVSLALSEMGSSPA